MQIQSTSLTGAGVSTTVQESTPVSSKEGAQGLRSTQQAVTPAISKPNAGQPAQRSTESLSEELKKALDKLNETVKKNAASVGIQCG